MQSTSRKIGSWASVGLFLALVIGLAVPFQAVQAIGTVVYVDNLAPSWDAPGGGGVYSGYYGPGNGYVAVSPGATTVFDGRQAGIIKAGLAIDPTDGVYEDEGLFGFQPNVTINALAAAALTYDVENQAGANPVWMTIEIDTGVAGNRGDNVTYQQVPAAYGAGWHTVDAAAGLWQKWDDNNGTVSETPIPLSAVAVAHTDLNVVRTFLRLGMGDSYHGTGAGTIAWVDKATIGGVTYDFVVPTYWYVSPTGLDTNEGTLISPFLTIQHAVASAAAGDTIHVAAGTYTEAGQMVISKNLTIVGADKATTIVKPGSDTIGDGDTGSWILVNDGVTLNLSKVTLDGVGRAIRQGVRFNGNGVVDDVVIQNMVAPGYMGFGIAQGYVNAGPRTLTVTNSSFTNYGRVGIQADNGTGTSTVTITGSTFTGKGAGDHIDYGITVEGGAHATITGNTFTNHRGVASTDGSESAGVEASTYFASGTTATITGNTFTNNSNGILVGYDGDDTSTVTAHLNKIYGNSGIGVSTSSSTVHVDAAHNWWGAQRGPMHTSNPTGIGDKVGDNVDFVAWCGDADCGTFLPPYGTTTTITSDTPEPSLVGASVTINFSVTNNVTGGPVPVGTVDITDGATVLCNDVPVATGTCSAAISAADARTLTATFTPADTALFAASSDTESHMVNAVPVIDEGSSLVVDMSRNGTPTPFTLTLHVTDANPSDTLTWDISSAATHGTASASGTGTSKAIGYTPNTDFGGWDAFTVRVTDAFGSTDTVIVHVYVSGNAAPVITEGASTTINMSVNSLPTAFALTLHATDEEHDALTWTLNTAATNGTASASGTGESLDVTYAPHVDFAGTDSFVVAVADSMDTDLITVNVNVNRSTSTLKSNATYDGWILERGRLGNTGGTMNSSGGTFMLGDDALNQQYRSILSFNTKLPAGAIVTKATLRIKQSGAPVGANPFGILGNIAVDLKKGNFGTASLQLGDFNALATKNAAMSIKNTAVSGWYSVDLITNVDALINKTNNTQLRLRFGKGDNYNSAANALRFFSGNSPNVNYRPQLIIEYYLPAAP